MERKEYLDYIFEVASHQMDLRGYLKPTVILNICQEAAYMHSTSLGFGFEELAHSNLAWVLSRVKVNIERLPVWHDKIRVRTWHKRQSGLFALRDYIFYDSNDNPIISITTSWLIINITSRRLMRVDRVLGGVDGFHLAPYPLEAIEAEAEKVDVEGEKRGLEPHRIVYSDLDVNGHVNNARYLGWACDNTPQQMDCQKRLSGFCINFNHESVYGEIVSLNTIVGDSDKVTIEGDVEGRAIFAISLHYEDVNLSFG